MKIKILFSILISASICAALQAQARAPHALYFMETIPQVSLLNPAVQPRANVYVALPVNFGIDLHSDLALKDLLQKQNNEYYSPLEREFDYNKFYRATGKNATMINFGIDAELLGFGFRTGDRGYFSFGISEHFAGKFALPTDLFKVPEKFFPDGEKYNLSPLRVEATAYMQFRIGYSHKINEKLTIGVNAKPLIGQAIATTKFEKFELTTGLDQWNIEAKGKIHASSPYEVVRNEKDNVKLLEGDEAINEMEFMDIMSKYLFGFNNMGIAFDFGAVYQINERLSVSAALNNIGFIAWNDDVSGLEFDGKFTLDENTLDLNLADYLQDNKHLDRIIDAIVDDLPNALEFEPYNKNFVTSPPPVLYTGASYLLTQTITAGFLSRTSFWQNAIRQSFNLSLNLQPYSFVSFTTGATWQVKGNVYLGTGFSVFMGPLQLYLMSDFIPIRYSTLTVDDVFVPFVPERQKTFTFRLGLNLVFGKHGYQNKPMLDSTGSSWQ